MRISRPIQAALSQIVNHYHRCPAMPWRLAIGLPIVILVCMRVFARGLFQPWIAVSCDLELTNKNRLHYNNDSSKSHFIIEPHRPHCLQYFTVNKQQTKFKHTVTRTIALTSAPLTGLLSLSFTSVISAALAILSSRWSLPSSSTTGLQRRVLSGGFLLLLSVGTTLVTLATLIYSLKICWIHTKSRKINLNRCCVMLPP